MPPSTVERDAPAPAGRGHTVGLALAAYSLFTAVTLWPLPRDPSRLTIHNEDIYGNAWVLAWVVHQAGTDPRRLFAANAFYPNPSSLVYTEPLLAQAVQAAPVLLAGGDPMLAHNLVLLATFPLSALGAFLLARELSGSAGAAFLAGLGYGFCAYRFAHVVHVQTLSAQWFPFVLLFLRRAARSGRARDLALLGVSSLLQALSSGYHAVLLAFAGGAALLWHAPEARRRGTLPKLLLVLGLSALLAATVFIPYHAASKRQEHARGFSFDRGREELVHWSARWSSYVYPGSWGSLPHQQALRRALEPSAPLFPTFVIGALALFAVARLHRHEPVRLALLLALVGSLLAFGPEMRLGPLTVPGPFELVRRLPGASLLRTPSRMGLLAILGLNLLAAMAWAHLTGAGRRSRVLLVGAASLIAVEAFPGGLAAQYRPADPPPATVEWLRSVPPAPTLELPWDHETRHYGGLYLYWSTGHWHPMVNGWGGFYPKDSFELGVLGKLFPSPYSSRLLRRAGIRYVIVHPDLIPADRPGRRRRAFSHESLPEGVSLAMQIGPDRIYTLEPEH